jgi:hypothetical protein
MNLRQADAWLRSAANSAALLVGALTDVIAGT